MSAPMQTTMQTTSHPAPATQGFAFSPERLAEAERILARYPTDRKASGILPLLDLAQRENGGWLSRPAQDYVAQLCEVAPIRVYEVASFYTMFYTEPVGEHVVQVCRTTPCWLRGADALTACAKQKLGIGLGETSADGKFTLIEVECLGACANAPMVQINDAYYEDLDEAAFGQVLDALGQGQDVPTGSQAQRQASAPQGGTATLVDFDAAQNKRRALAAFHPPEPN